MAFIDDRGRLFGKVNVIDFALIALFLVLIPLGYGAYRLLRTPAPQLTAVTPNPLVFKKGEQRVRVTGTNLRPFARAKVGNADAKAFLVERPDAGEVVFENLPAGTYDLSLYDFAEEVARLRNAITIVPQPAPPVQIVGHFVGASAAAGRLAPGTKLPDAASAPLEVISVQALAGGSRGIFRTSCSRDAPCSVGGTPLAAGKRIDLHVPGSPDGVPFVVDELRVEGLWATVRVQVFGIAEVLELVKAGDRDLFLSAEVPVAPPPGVAGGAVVRSVDSVQPTEGAFALNFSQGLSDAIGGFSGSLAGNTHLPLKSRSALLSVPIERTPIGWRYRNQYVRPGSGLTLETTKYVLRALILSVTLPDGTPAQASGQ
jgi:hypothetical protein